jgi:dephospho-CoA kinase
VIGLAGGVAAGKSTVARMFADLGAEVIDADAIARKVIEMPEVCDEIRRRWDGDLFTADGRPDRAKIAEKVFADPDKLRELTGLMHPIIRQRMQEQIADAARHRRAPLIVIDAPLLLEAGLAGWCDAIVFVES